METARTLFIIFIIGGVLLTFGDLIYKTYIKK